MAEQAPVQTPSYKNKVNLAATKLVASCRLMQKEQILHFDLSRKARSDAKQRPIINLYIASGIL